MRSFAREISRVLGGKVPVEQVLEELDRFINIYRIELDEAKRAVLVLHGIPAGLVGPRDRRFTWQAEIDSFGTN